MLTNERLAAGIRFGTVLLLGTTMAAAGVSRATAQDASAEESHPAHIHAGSCGPNLGDVVYPLTNVSDNGMAEGMAASMATPGAGGMASPAAGEMGQMMGAASAVPVETSYTVVNASLQDLLSKPYAINVHESKEKIQNYIACGDLGGQIKTGPGMMQGGTLTIGLKELNNSGYSGVAVLQGQGDQTRVVLFLAEGLSGAAATPAAAESGESYGAPAAGSPSAPAASSPSAESGQNVAATIKNFAYSPDPIQISVGTKVTWTNDDSTQHTVTGTDQTVIKSPVLNPGDTYSVTFTKPGTYPYHCEFHANMHGTVVVK